MSRVTPVLILVLALSGCISYRKKRPRRPPAIELTAAQKEKLGKKALAKLAGSRELFDDNDLQDLCLLNHLRDLDLSYTQVTTGGLRCIGKLPNLEYINLHGTGVDDRVFDALRALPKLSILVLSKTKIDGWALASLGNIQSLRRLTLNHCALKGKAFEALRQMRQLKRLNIRSVKTSLTLDFLKKLSLTHLDLSGNRLRQGALAALGTQRELQGLNLSQVPLRGLKISKLEGLQKLRELYAAQAGLTDREARIIASLSELRRLDLHGNAISSAGLKALLKLTHLTHLSLSGEKFLSSRALVPELKFRSPLFTGKILGAVTWPQKLEHLSLTTSDFDDLALSGLSLKNLRTLDLSQTYVSKAALEAFKNRFPACEVTWFQTRVVAPLGRHETPSF